MDRRPRRALARAGILSTAGLLVSLALAPAAGAVTGGTSRYLVVFGGTYALDGSYALGGNYALNHDYALGIVKASGGTVVEDLTKQIGVAIVDGPSSTFYALMKSYALVEAVGEDYAWQGIDDYALGGGYALDGGGALGSGAGPNPETVDDPGEALQWDMAMINADRAHDVQGGRPEVQVGVLDSGISGYHVDFTKDGVSNVDCAKGRNSVSFVVAGGPGLGIDDPCVDNQFHGTHVAGTIAARANGIGVTGVAPNVTLVPVKVCDTSGYCYASAVVDGLTYAGDQQFEVVNMSFFVDDDTFQASTEFKCSSDPTQAAFRTAVNRALAYARNRGVVEVAALGNEDQDLAHPVDDAGQPIDNGCAVVPAESSGVVGTGAVGPDSGKASYSNYGTGKVDLVAPGGDGTTGDCTTTILSTLPGNAYGCIQGTSMASPHTAGVAALIVSQFGAMGADGDWKMSVTTVESILQSTAVDIGLKGYDECFGNGRIDAFRAVTKTTRALYDRSAPACPEYTE